MALIYQMKKERKSKMGNKKDNFINENALRIGERIPQRSYISDRFSSREAYRSDSEGMLIDIPLHEGKQLGEDDFKSETNTVQEYDLNLYNEDQLQHLLKGRGSDAFYGDISNLDPTRYNADQLYWMSLSRGNYKKYGPIENLEPERFNFNQMRIISRGNGHNQDQYADVSNLDPKTHSWMKMKRISEARALVDRIWKKK